METDRQELTCIGIFTDFVKNRIGVSRAYCISLVAVFFFISQLVAMSVVDVTELWKASLLVGFSYGAMFGLFPTITIDWFGMCESCGPNLQPCLIMTSFDPDSSLFRELGVRRPFSNGRGKPFLHGFRKEPRWAHLKGIQPSTDDVTRHDDPRTVHGWGGLLYLEFEIDDLGMCPRTRIGGLGWVRRLEEE